MTLGSTVYIGPGGDVVIPEGVTSIRKYAFEAKNVTTLFVPSSVELIGKCAFERCFNLATITLHGSLQGIGENALIDCKKLQNIWIVGTGEDVERIQKLLPAWLRDKVNLLPPSAYSQTRDEVAAVFRAPGTTSTSSPCCIA